MGGMETFKVGDRIEVLDEALSGVVQKVEGERVTVVLDDGFPMQYHPRELLRKGGGLRVSNFEIGQVKKEKELPKKRKVPVQRPKERQAPKMEVDLHIHQLVASTRGLGNFDMLNLQLEHARRQLEFAMQK